MGKYGIYAPGDQSLPADVVAVYFEVNDKVLAGTMTPQQAAERMEKASADYKAKNP